jgi:hypothetical protein
MHPTTVCADLVAFLPLPSAPAVATENFDQQEAQLARDLEALITDAHYLKHYSE